MSEPVSVEVLRAKPPAGAVDPDVKIPKAVLAAGKQAEEIQRQITGAAEPSVLPPPDGVPSEPTDGGPQAQLQDPPPSPSRDDLEGEPAAGDNWERRFKGLQGRYDKDVRQVRAHLDQMSDQITRLQQENTTLRSAGPPAPQPNAPPAQSLLSEQEIQDYGPEFIDVARRIAQEVAAPLHAEIYTLRNQLGSVQQETGNVFLTRMDSEIGASVKNWRELNVHPKFMEWVKLPDVFSGAIRQQLMQEAWNAGDSRRVAAFFQAFLAEEAAVDPQRANGQTRPASRMVVSPANSPTGAPMPATPQMTLEALAAPGRAHSAATPAEKPVYSSADITRFYTDVKLGRYRGREQQQAAIDADIMLAQREGRIIPDQRAILPAGPNGAVR